MLLRRSLRRTGEAAHTLEAGLQNSPRNCNHARSVSYGSRSAHPMKHTIDSHFEALVQQTPPTPATVTPPTPPPRDELPKTDREETLSRARVVFGSRLAGPAEHRASREAHSKMIAGVLVPPRPAEPDNCCMSGCVNCVWDQYRDDLEEWAEKRGEADRRLAMQGGVGLGEGSRRDAGDVPAHVASSMDDDGGGSETNWSVPTGDLFADIPVGIKEFMRTEKRLKERKKKKKRATGVA